MEAAVAFRRSCDFPDRGAPEPPRSRNTCEITQERVRDDEVLLTMLSIEVLQLLLTGVAVEKLFPAKFTNIKSH
jgi:hypothetical protein